MKIRDLFEHHGVLGNPFSEEDAQNDAVFKTSCIKTSFHSAWDKIYGDPNEPSTSVVFGEKGSGKTALRIQMIRMLSEYNTDHPEARPIVIDYADLNPFIDRFRHRFPRSRKIQKVFARWELWDHLDAILSLGTTQLIDRILEPGQTSHPAAVDPKPLPVEKLNSYQVRDLLLLASCYDTSRSENPTNRWARLSKKLRYRTWTSLFSNNWEMLLGILGTLLSTFLFYKWSQGLGFLGHRWFYIVLILLWVPLLWKMGRRFWKAWSLRRSLRVLPHLKADLFKILMRLQKPDFNGMPFPISGNTDHRYEMLEKFLAVCQTLGLNGMIVLVDRVDEPYLVNGSAELMKLIVWPILDNKLLKHDRVGLKLLLPDQLLYYMEREDDAFHQRARIDKQNLVRSLDWTGESLFDLANDRLRACAADGRTPLITDFFDPVVDRRRLVDAFARLKVPRHLFKFLYSLFGKHVNMHTETDPAWTIPEATFETALSLYLRDREAAKKNLGVV